MPIINPEVLALARISSPNEDGVFKPIYQFSNGFDAVKVDGAPNQPVIYVPNPSIGTFVVFLSNPEDAGNPTTQGGIKARVDVVRVSSAENPAPSLLAVRNQKALWYYGDFNLPSAYAGVDPKKAIVIETFRRTAGNWVPNTLPIVVDIAVFRDPVTKFVGKKSS